MTDHASSDKNDYTSLRYWPDAGRLYACIGEDRTPKHEKPHDNPYTNCDNYMQIMQSLRKVPTGPNSSLENPYCDGIGV
jgi:hypothetical protein